MTKEADFHGQDLRGRSFRGAALDGADFRGADLRGADFTDASLVEADLTDARLGVRPLAGIVMLGGAVAVSIATGVIIGMLAEATRERATSSDWRDILASALIVGVVALFLAVLFLKGTSTAFRVVLIAVIGIVIVDFVVVFAVAGELRFRTGLPLIALLAFAAPAAVAGILGRIVGGTFGAWAIASVAALGGFAAGRAHGGLAAVAVSVLLVLVSKRALKGDERDGPIRNIGHRIVTHRGTRFTDADVTGANFTGAVLMHSDLSSAVTDGAMWEPGQAPYTIKPPG